MDDITKTLESLEKPDLLIDCATETVKLEEMKKKNKKVVFFGLRWHLRLLD